VRWLIDGYNVIRRDPDLRGREAESLEAGRAALLRLVANLARRSGDEFVVVFDGAPVAAPPSSGGRVRVLFSRRPESADEVLGRLAAQWREGAVVVSSDRTVQGAARRAGATALEAERFLSAAAGERPEDDGDDDREDDGPPVKRGNPRRLSREERAARRALARLAGRGAR
jgi:predicted RNA-binding protein with PIN domain